MNAKVKLTHFAAWNIPTRILFLTAILLIGRMPVAAQNNITITGNVLYADKEPIIGASVLEAGTLNGVITDVDGKFSIKVSSANTTLVVSYLGMKTEQIKTNGKTQLTILMEEDRILIDDVVVTALGIKRESKALGYAVASVDNETLTAANEQNVMSALMGKVAGVDISGTTAGPSGSTRVLIRGNSQLSGSNQPLYVIDGMPVDNTELDGAGKNGGYDYGDVMSSLNPDDIENISILKGPSASALYGSRASNGVVLITTKSGQGKKGIGIEFSSNVSFVKLLTYFDDYQRVYGQGRDGQPPLDWQSASGTTQVAWGGKLDPNLTVPIYNGEMKSYGNVNNNILSFFNTGVTATNSIAFTKSADDHALRLSISNMQNKDIVPESKLQRTTVTFKGNTKIGKNFTIEAQATYTDEGVNNRPALADSPNNLGNALIGIAPSFDQKWLASNYKDESGRYNEWNGDKYRINPYWIIHEMTNESRRNRLIGQARLSYEIIPDLVASVKAGVDTYTFRVTEFTPRYTPDVLEGALKERNNNVLQYNYEVMLRYRKKINKFDLSGFIGGNLMQYRFESMIQTGRNQIVPELEDITNYSTIETEHILSRKEVRSLFGQASAGYNDIVYVDVTLRNDVSSTLNPDNRSYVYPSVSGSLIFSNMFAHDKWLTFGKVRASWAKVGGDTDPYRLSLEYGLKSYTVNGVPLGQITSGTVPFNDLKPTSTYSMEVGLDVKFFDNRLGLDLTLYKQTTKDQILSLPISQTTGYNRAMINAGEITNQGIEVALTGVPVQTRNFSWTTNLNFAKNVNKVVKLHEDVKDYELAAARWANAFIYASEGEAYGVIVGKKLQRTEAGEIIFENGLPTYEENVSVLGNGNYDFTLGFRNVFNYKNLSASVLVDMKFGADVYSMSMMQAHLKGTSKNTLEGREEWYASEQARLAANASVGDWQPTGGYLGQGVKLVVDENGNESYVPNDVYVNPYNYWNSIHNNSPEPFIYNNSYIKLRELSFSYTFPKKWLLNTPVESVSLSAYGRNLFLLYSKLKNIDPESSYNNGNGQGFEYGSLPSRRTFGFGINVKF
ncbi:MAG: SusC/RagA family TonB-linked outer membrane protein [Tannerellaceae bacterium]|nr:SusC/RagA family TonB-linked outer membrane protein [Tannerellaceae bacterium]